MSLCQFAKVVPLIALFADALAVPMMATADAPASTGPYTLTCKYIVGQTHRYSLTMDINEIITASGKKQPMTLHFDMLSTQTVQSVRASDGAATVAIAYRTLDGSANGQPLPEQILQQTEATMPTMTATLAQDGKILSYVLAPGSQPPPGLTDPSSMLDAAILPTKPVNIGDTWTGTMPSPLNSTLNLQSTLSSVKDISGQIVAHIRTTNVSVPSNNSTKPDTSPVPTGSMSGQVDTDFNINSGTITSFLDRTQSTTTKDMPDPSGVESSPIHVTIDSFTLVKMNLLPGVNATMPQ